MSKDFERQYPLSTDFIEIAFGDLEDGVAADAVDLPKNAVIVGGEVIVDEAWDGGEYLDELDTPTLKVGDEDSATRYSSGVDLTATGRTALTLTSFRYVEPSAILVLYEQAGGGDPEQGRARLRIEYTVQDRGNENQG
jgi:hypothetical protein